MKLFWKDKELDINIEKLKLTIKIIIILCILIVSYFGLILKVNKVFKDKKRLEYINKELKQIELKEIASLNILKEAKEEEARKTKKLDELMLNFQNRNYLREIELKEEIQNTLDTLGIELVEIGKTETLEEEKDLRYIKKVIPYKISGNSSSIKKFFYILEKSKYSVGVSENRVEISIKTYENFESKKESSKNEIDKTIRVEARFKLNYFYIKNDESYGSIGKGIENKNTIQIDENKLFKESYEDIEKKLKEKFKVKMILTKNGISSALIEDLRSSPKKRLIIKDERSLEINNKLYHVKIFSDRVDIKQGNNEWVISIYPKE